MCIKNQFVIEGGGGGGGEGEYALEKNTNTYIYLYYYDLKAELIHAVGQHN